MKKVLKTIPKKIAKKFKKSKSLFLALFLAKSGFDRMKKRKKNFLCQISFIPEPGIKIPKKISKTKAKKLKKLKNLFPVLLFVKTGCNKLKKRERTFSFKFRSYSIRGRKF